MGPFVSVPFGLVPIELTAMVPMPSLSPQRPSRPVPEVSSEFIAPWICGLRPHDVPDADLVDDAGEEARGDAGRGHGGADAGVLDAVRPRGRFAPTTRVPSTTPSR